MPTVKRVWYPGAIYHVTARGNRKSDIFYEREDYKVYLDIIKEALEYYKENNYELICYCLMTNHVHLLFKTTDKELGHIIGRINGRYAIYFNEKYGYVGHLFQGRYHCKIIRDDLHMIVESRYIHLNPVKAKIVKTPENYEWSSYSMYIGMRKIRLIATEKILGYFNKKDESNQYKEFIENQIKTLMHNI